MMGKSFQENMISYYDKIISTLTNYYVEHLSTHQSRQWLGSKYL